MKQGITKTNAIIPLDVVGHETTYDIMVLNNPCIKLYENEYVHLFKSGNIFLLDLPSELYLFREISKDVKKDLANIFYKHMFIDKKNIDELTIYTWNIKENIMRGIYSYAQEGMIIHRTLWCGWSTPKQIIKFINEINEEMENINNDRKINNKEMV